MSIFKSKQLVVGSLRAKLLRLKNCTKNILEAVRKTSFQILEEVHSHLYYERTNYSFRISTKN